MTLEPSKSSQQLLTGSGWVESTDVVHVETSENIRKLAKHRKSAKRRKIYETPESIGNSLKRQNIFETLENIGKSWKHRIIVETWENIGEIVEKQLFHFLDLI